MTAHKPAHVVFESCRPFADLQGKPMRATYHVDGRYAAGTEASLNRTLGLKRLHRSCCVWDAPATSFMDKQGRRFSLTMTSGETLVARRADWRHIPSFTITVDAYTEQI